MGSELIITTFAVVVIGGLGSNPRLRDHRVRGRRPGAIGSALYPPIANTLIFILMALSSSCGRAACSASGGSMNTRRWIIRVGVLLVLLALPRMIYPVLAVDILSWGLFALAFDLVFGYAGLLSFGHAMFWGTSGYVTRTCSCAPAFPRAVASRGHGRGARPGAAHRLSLHPPAPASTSR